MGWNDHARTVAGGQRGFSLLELTVVVCLIAILVVVAMDRIWSLRIEAERVAVAQVVGTLRSALGLELARRVVHGGVATIAELDGGNPMELLAQQPSGYRGVRMEQGSEGIDPGEWYFDAGAHVLVYRVRFAEAFVSAAGDDRAVYRLTLKYRDRDGNGRFEPNKDAVYGLDLLPVGEFGWGKLPESWWERWF